MLSRCFLDFSVGVRASVIGLSQISSFSLITEFWRFPWNIATGAASQQRTLTPPDTWSCPIWDLHLFKC